MREWDDAFERECRALVETIADSSIEKPGRDLAWRELMTRIAPHIENWARRSPALRRCRLDGEDDARAVLIAVMARLSQREYENLGRFVAGQAAADGDGDSDDDDSVDDSEPRGGPARTPLRGWLLGLSRFAIKDHLKQRLGWNGPAPDAVAEGGRQASKRDLGTDAARFDELLEQGARPPMTDMLTRRRLFDEVMAYAATLPPDMQGALEGWMNDLGFDEIAAQLGLADADAARALVRAATARLRDRLRGR